APTLDRWNTRRNTSDAARKAVAAWVSPDALPHPYFFARALFPLPQLSRIAQPRLRASTIGSDGVTLEPTWLGWLQLAADAARKLEPTPGVGWLEMRTYMASTLLRDTDAVSMARSLEVRVPLLDTPVVEFVQTLPELARQKAHRPKALLVEAVGDLLPPSTLAGPKRTFTLPFAAWLRDPLQPRLAASFAEPAPALAPFLRKDAMRAVSGAFSSGKTSWSRVWSLFVLNEWCRQNLPS